MQKTGFVRFAEIFPAAVSAIEIVDVGAATYRPGGLLQYSEMSSHYPVAIERFDAVAPPGEPIKQAVISDGARRTLFRTRVPEMAFVPAEL